jgi:hypothetical protein
MIHKTLILITLLTVIHCQYNQQLGLNLCQLTVASYCNPQRLQDWSCGPCQTSGIKIDNVQTFRNSSGNVIGFIGTSASPSATCNFVELV